MKPLKNCTLKRITLFLACANWESVPGRLLQMASGEPSAREIDDKEIAKE